MINIDKLVDLFKSSPEMVVSKDTDSALEQLPFELKDIFFAEAFTEMESSVRADGLWAMILTQNNFDEGKSKSLYIKCRALQLFLEHQLHTVQENRAGIESEKKEEEARNISSAYELYMAVKQRDVNEVKRLFALGVDPDIKLEDGTTVITYAIYEGYTDIVSIFHHYRLKRDSNS